MLRSVEQTIYIVHGLYPTHVKTRTRTPSTTRKPSKITATTTTATLKKPYNKLVYVQPVNPETGIQILYLLDFVFDIKF